MNRTSPRLEEPRDALVAVHRITGLVEDSLLRGRLPLKLLDPRIAKFFEGVKHAGAGPGGLGQGACASPGRVLRRVGRGRDLGGVCDLKQWQRLSVLTARNTPPGEAPVRMKRTVVFGKVFYTSQQEPGACENRSPQRSAGA